MKEYYWKLTHYIKRLNVYLTMLKLKQVKQSGKTTENCIKILGDTVHYGDISQFITLFKEVYVNRNYFINLPANPLIIDAGANIGIAALFFSRHYAGAKIISFEPSPSSFALLEQNVKDNNLIGVELHNSAVGDTEEPIPFYMSSDMPEGDIGATAVKKHLEYFWGDNKTIEIKVPCEKLSNYLNQKVDLLKIDVEGNERKVLDDIDGKLGNVQNLVMEYHYNTTHNENLLSTILSVLERNGHAYKILGDNKLKMPGKEETYMIYSRLIG